MLNPHAFAGEIKRHPEAEVLLATRDNRAEVMKKVLTWLMAGGTEKPALQLNTTPSRLERTCLYDCTNASFVQ
jgi:hypothetical protein